MAIEYTTWNPDDKNANITLSNGDLIATATNTTWKSVRTVLGKSSGKWYWEIKISTDADRCLIGIGTTDESLSSYVGDTANGYSYYDQNGNKFHDDLGTAYGDSFTLNDVVGIALDLDNGKLWFSKNGVWQASGNPEAGTSEAWSGISGTFFPMYSPYANTDAVIANFGASAFSYSVPSGFSSGFYSGSEDPKYCVSGYVKKGTISVNRQIYLHNRDTGALITSTTSSGIGGYFYMETTYSGAHYVVCLDDVMGVSYNDLIYGNIYPATTSG